MDRAWELSSGTCRECQHLRGSLTLRMPPGPVDTGRHEDRADRVATLGQAGPTKVGALARIQWSAPETGPIGRCGRVSVHRGRACAEALGALEVPDPPCAVSRAIRRASEDGGTSRSAGSGAVTFIMTTGASSPATNP